MKRLFRYEVIDVVIAMGLAGLVNAAMLVMAAKTFNERGLVHVNAIEKAYMTLQAVLGSAATTVFALSLLVHAAPDRPAPDAFRQLAVSLDGRAEHEVALPLAAELAGLYAAPVRLVMAIPTRGMLSGSPSAVGQLLPAATTEVPAPAAP